MPIYEFKCERCDEEFEVSASMSEYEALYPNCPKCGSQKLNRRWSSPAIHVDHAE